MTMMETWNFDGEPMGTVEEWYLKVRFFTCYRHLVGGSWTGVKSGGNLRFLWISKVNY